MWFYHSGANCYTFLPFRFGWTSPYGNSYSNTFYGGPGYTPAYNPNRPYGNGQTVFIDDLIWTHARAPTSTPEPGSAILLTAGCLGLLSRRRRHGRNIS